MSGRFLRQLWYQAGFTHEVGATPLARTILDMPIVLFRSNGEVCALHDACPHRFAPLSTGRIDDGIIVCGYHGIGFDRSGACARNPHGPLTSALTVRAFPAVERHGAIWVWMGEPQAADPAAIPDLSFIDETPETARIHFTIHVQASYQLITDNLLDLSHADYLHASSLGGVMTGVRPKASETLTGIAVEWENIDVVPPPRFREAVPADQRANAWTRSEWHPAALMVIKTALSPSDRARHRDDEVWALHSMTPETATTTHYFVCGTRRDRMDDIDYSARLRTMLKHAFEMEDKVMLEDQQRRIGQAGLENLRPALLPIDTGAVLARRRLERMLAEEAAVPARSAA